MPVADDRGVDWDQVRVRRAKPGQEGSSTYTESTFYIGAVEIITDNSSGTTKTVTKTTISPNVMHVKIVGTTTEQFFEYAHRDQLGSIEVVTDGSGNVLDNLAFENFGARKGKDWSANIPSTDLEDLLELGTGHSRKARGFTGHEHLDRTGFVHMNGRLYDPGLGRFLSPDPYVQFPTFSQSWNRYSYVNNSPASFSDPSGYHADITGMEGEGATNATGYGGSAGGYASARSAAVFAQNMLNIGGVYDDRTAQVIAPTLPPIGERTTAVDSSQMGPCAGGGQWSGCHGSSSLADTDILSGVGFGVGTLAERAGAVRSEYIRRAAALDPSDVSGRIELQNEIRGRLNALGRAYTQSVLKSRAGQTPRLSNASKTNLGVNHAASVFKYGGRALQIGAVGYEAYNVATAPPDMRGQVATQAGGRLTGGLGGAYAGAQVGAIGGPWGAAGGAVVGGVLGSIGGEALVNAVFGFE